MTVYQKDNWKTKLRKNPAYIFYLIKKWVASLFRREPVKKAVSFRSEVKPLTPEVIPAPVSEPVMPEPEPELVPERNALDPEKLNLACIMDIFTKSCFSPEFNMISPTPENWKQMMDKDPVDAVFIESAWHGNDDAWLYKVGSYQERFMEPVRSLIENCKEKKIPAIFWNKEDPVHFDKFLDTAHRCDYIFTTDADCIPKYIEKAGHEHVYALPFAAQEKIHNPVLDQPRDGMVCFAGTYHVNRYADRRSDMDVILKPALDFGLDIYDRMYGTEGKAADNYRFPDIYQPAIRGKLDYEDMMKAYRRYKVFLNVNSVRNSPTMFARRVFELLACGTPVISTYSKGIIDILGEDTVFITESEEQTTGYLEKLIHDETFWWKHSLHGIRKVLENHTYHHRTKLIFDAAGLKFTERPEVKFVVVAEISSGENLKYLAAMLSEQVYRDFSVLLICKPAPDFDEIMKAEAMRLLAPHKVDFTTGDSLKIREALAEVPDDQYIALFNTVHFYGKNYLRDYALAVNYSGAGIMGKKSFFSYNDSGKIIRLDKNADFHKVREVRAASLVINADNLKSSDLMSILKQETYKISEPEILSIDSYNFLQNGALAPEITQTALSI